MIFIKRLDPSLLTLSDLNEFKGRLRCCIFDELTVSWYNYPCAKLCHVIHTSWTPRSWTRMNFSRQTECFYHQIAVGRGKFGDRYKYSKKMRSCNPNCKFGCNVISSVHHFFFDCPHCVKDILNLQDICARKRIEYSLENLFTKTCLLSRVQLFLKKIISYDF